jgi:hypothetical protein
VPGATASIPLWSLRYRDLKYQRNGFSPLEYPDRVRPSKVFVLYSSIPCDGQAEPDSNRTEMQDRSRIRVTRRNHAT